MVDTHCHLGLSKAPVAQLVGAARDAGLNRMLDVGVDEATSRAAIAAAERYEEVRACVGRHPNGATGFDDAAAAKIEELARHPRVAAVGETGLDFYRDRAAAEDQHRAFRAQIAIARRVGKPLVIHVRDSAQTTDGEALEGVFETLRAEATDVDVILHCFSAPPPRALEAGERGWYCSFAGNATYPNAEELREAARIVPEHLILVETDSPYLTPQPHRGKPNQPANVVETARTIAAVRGIALEAFEELVEENAARAFGW